MDLDLLFNEANIDHSQIKPNFIPDTPACYSKPFDVDLSLTEFPKETTSDLVYQANFGELLTTKYADYCAFYTDGSKQDERTSFAVKHDFGVVPVRIADNSSIFTAEAEGIKLALRFVLISTREVDNYVVFSDSKSVLESLSTYNSNNVIIKELLDLIRCIIRRKKTISLCWVPGHAGIVGNELADQAAKRALRRARGPSFRIPYQDLFPQVRAFIRQRWQKRWDDSHAKYPIKMHAVQPIIAPHHLSGLTRKEEVIIHRLRIGHTRLTQAYKFQQRGPNKQAPSCHFCYDPEETLTVNHLLIECTEFRHVRRRYYHAPDLQHLFENTSPRQIFNFLKEVHLYNQL